MGKFIDLSGQKFGRLTVLHKSQKQNGRIYWTCQCECGKIKDICASSLTSGATKSCGCFQREQCSISNSRNNSYKIVNGTVCMTTSSGVDFYVSIEDLEKVSKYCWAESNGYIISCKSGKMIKLHRFVMNATASQIVDHIDGNKQNNIRSNLRIVNKSQNAMNSKKRYDNKSGVTGVVWNARKNKWVARIKYNYKDIHLGYFENIEDAKKARREAEDKYFGEYAYSNSR